MICQSRIIIKLILKPMTQQLFRVFLLILLCPVTRILSLLQYMLVWAHSQDILEQKQKFKLSVRGSALRKAKKDQQGVVTLQYRSNKVSSISTGSWKTNHYALVDQFGTKQPDCHKLPCSVSRKLIIQEESDIE